MSAKRRWLLVTGGLVVAALAVGLARRGPAPWEVWQPEPVTLPSPNGFDLARTASETVWEGTDEAIKTAAGRAEVAARNCDTLVQLRRALPMPFMAPPAYAQEHWSRSYIPFRRMSRVLVVEARWHLDRGEAAEALRCRLDAAELGVKVSHGAPFADVMAAQSVERTGRRDAWDEVARLSGRDAAAGARRLESLGRERVGLPEQLRCERRQVLGDWSRCLSQASNSELTHAFMDLDHRQVAWLLWSHGGRSGLWRDLVRYENDSIVAAEAAPLGREPWPNLDRYAPVVGLCVARLDLQAHSTIANLTGANLWQAALALRAYQADHGDYPASLEALVPGYLAAAPQDVFALAPLRYVRTGGGYRLYSVGPDRADDGGRPLPTAKTGSWDQDAKGDAVWGSTRI